MKLIHFPAVTLALLGTSPAFAQAITSYDITGASQSGFGNWNHNYSGTITGPASGATYTGGSGTLNDGIIPGGFANNHLFDNSLQNPTVTVYLDGFYRLSSISILSNYILNTIPGNIASVNVTIGGVSQSYATVGFGPLGNSGFPISEIVNLSGLQSTLAVNQFTLSRFETVGPTPQFFAIGELQVNGAAAVVSGAVPEPSTWAMLLLGFFGLGAALRFQRGAQRFCFSYR